MRLEDIDGARFGPPQEHFNMPEELRIFMKPRLHNLRPSAPDQCRAQAQRSFRRDGNSRGVGEIVVSLPSGSGGHPPERHKLCHSAWPAAGFVDSRLS